MTKDELIERNRKFVIGVLNTIESLPSNRIYDALVRQLVRSSTSIGANYLTESNQLIAIYVASLKTMRVKLSSEKIKNRTL